VTTFSPLTELLLLFGRGETASLGTMVDNGAIVSVWIIDEWIRSVGGKIGRRYLKYSQKALSYSHFIHDKFRVDWTGSELSPSCECVTVQPKYQM